MHRKVVTIISLCIFMLAMVASVSTKQKVADPSVPDETDLAVIDEFLKPSTPSSNTNKSSNPDRGALPPPDQNPSKEQPVTTTTTLKPPPPDPNPSKEPPVATTTTVKPSQTETQQCKCVKYYLCQVGDSQNLTNSSGQETTGNNTLSSEGTNGTAPAPDISGVVDIRKTELKNLHDNSTLSHPNGTSDANNDLCENYFDVCCPLDKIKPSNETQNNSTSPEHEVQSTTYAPPSTNPETHQCGHRNEKGVGFTITGATQGEAQFGEFPWTVAVIQLEQAEDNPNLTLHKYIGGGSLLHPQVVLTVAHNVLGKSKAALKVRLGEWDTQTNDEPYPSQDRKVKKVIIHERFTQKALINDVALLILDEEARLAPNVDTVCLPPVNKTMKFEGQICYSAGWGKDHFGAEGRYSEIMKKVAVPVVHKDKCEKELSKSEKLPGFHLDKSFMCAGGGESGDDTCKGDGGSALVCSITDKSHTHYVQVGAVSWGLGCKNPQFPGVYSDVAHLTPWILKQMEKEGMSTEYCTIHNK